MKEGLKYERLEKRKKDRKWEGETERVCVRIRGPATPLSLGNFPCLVILLLTEK